MRKIALAFAFMLLSGAALASQPPVDQYPAFLKPFVPQAEKPLGQAELKWTWFKVYDIALWTAGPKWSYDIPFALHVRYVRDVSADALTENTLKEMNTPVELPPQEEDNARAELLAIMPDVKAGDTITAIHVPGQYMSLYYNGQLAGRITDHVLEKRFFDIWLGPKASHPDIARALKGEKP